MQSFRLLFSLLHQNLFLFFVIFQLRTVIKPAVTDTLILIYVAFVMNASLIARLAILGILVSDPAAFAFRADLIAPYLVFNLFNFALYLVFWTRPIRIYLPISSTFFLRLCLLQPYSILVTNVPLFAMLVQLVLNLITNLLSATGLTKSLSTTFLSLLTSERAVLILSSGWIDLFSMLT